MIVAALTFAAFTVTLDGRTVLPRTRTAVVGGRVLLPVRAVGRALDADVGYDGAARVIVLQRGAHVARLPASGAVRVVAGRAYAPLRALASAFGVTVAYDARSRTVALDDRTGAGRVGAGRAGAGYGPGNSVASGTAPGSGTNANAGTARGYASGIAGVQPPDGAVVHAPYPTIAARVDGADAIDRTNFRLVVDGRDVTADASVVGNAVIYTPRGVLNPGRHDVALYANDLTRNWSFDDDFVFATPPPGTFAGPAVDAIYFDRYVGPGTNAFDVIVRGVPGLVGVVAVDGVGTLFPLQVYTTDTYVAHVYVPPGVYQPFARVGVRLTLPGGVASTFVLPQTVQLQTGPVKYYPPVTPLPVPSPAPSRSPGPVRRPLPHTPSPTPAAPATRVPLATAVPSAKPAASTAPKPPMSALPAASPSPVPSTSPAPKKRLPLKRRPTPTPTP